MIFSYWIVGDQEKVIYMQITDPPMVCLCPWVQVTPKGQTLSPLHPLVATSTYE